MFKRFLLTLIIIGFIFVSAMATREWFRTRSMQQKISATKRQIAELEQKNREIEDFLASLQDERVLEREVRERLNLRKPGEIMVILVPPSAQGQEKFPQPEPEKPKPWFLANALSWWEFIFSSRKTTQN